MPISRFHRWFGAVEGQTEFIQLYQMKDFRIKKRNNLGIQNVLNIKICHDFKKNIYFKRCIQTICFVLLRYIKM